MQTPETSAPAEGQADQDDPNTAAGADTSGESLAPAATQMDTATSDINASVTPGGLAISTGAQEDTTAAAISGRSGSGPATPAVHDRAAAPISPSGNTPTGRATPTGRVPTTGAAGITPPATGTTPPPTSGTISATGGAQLSPAASGNRADPLAYDIYIGNVAAHHNANTIVNLIHGFGIDMDLIQVQEKNLRSRNDTKAFKATVPYINHSDIIVALMTYNKGLIVEKHRPTKQTQRRQSGGTGPGNNFRGPGRKPFPQRNQWQQQQYQPNQPRWYNPAMPFGPSWNYFGPPANMQSFGPQGWGYQQGN